MKNLIEEIEKENQELKGLQELNKQGLWNLKQECERWRKLCLCWREAYIECDEKFHNLCKEVLKDDK